MTTTRRSAKRGGGADEPEPEKAAKTPAKTPAKRRAAALPSSPNLPWSLPPAGTGRAGGRAQTRLPHRRTQQAEEGRRRGACRGAAAAGAALHLRRRRRPLRQEARLLSCARDRPPGPQAPSSPLFSFHATILIQPRTLQPPLVRSLPPGRAHGQGKISEQPSTRPSLHSQKGSRGGNSRRVDPSTPSSGRMCLAPPPPASPFPELCKSRCVPSASSSEVLTTS